MCHLFSVTYSENKLNDYCSQNAMSDYRFCESVCYFREGLSDQCIYNQQEISDLYYIDLSSFRISLFIYINKDTFVN